MFAVVGREPGTLQLKIEDNSKVDLISQVDMILEFSPFKNIANDNAKKETTLNQVGVVYSSPNHKL